MSSDARFERIRAVVRRIPRGRVASYGQIARIAGFARGARLAARALRANSDPGLPWHRVVNARGCIAIPAGDPAHAQQIRRLVAEGVDIENDRIDLSRFGWRGHDSSPLLD